MPHNRKPKKLVSPIWGDQLSLLELELLEGNSQTASSNNLPPNTNHWIEERWIKRSGKLYGPYLYERWREGGKKKSRYLGRAKSEEQ